MTDLMEQRPKPSIPNPNLAGSNSKQKEIARLRSVVQDEAESPTERLVAATKLLSRFGPSTRSVPIINAVLNLYLEHSDLAVAERAMKLQVKLTKARHLQGASKSAEISGPQSHAGLETDKEPEFPSNADATVAPRLNFDWHDLHRIVTEPGVVKKGDSRREKLLERVLRGLPLTVINVQLVLDELNKKNEGGWSLAMSFEIIVEAALDWLANQGITEPKAQHEAAGVAFAAKWKRSLYGESQ